MMNNAKLFAVIAVIALSLCVVGVLADMDESDARVIGSSSEPVISITGDMIDIADDTYYAAVGSTVSITTDSSYFCEVSDVTSGFGLTITDSRACSGIISKAGTITVTGIDENHDSRYVTIIAVETVDFTSPSAVDAISGSSISYQATTNVSGTTFSKDGGNASWLTLTSAGKLTGTAPSVTTATDYTFGIKATTESGQIKTQTVTFTIYPVAKLTASPASVTGTVGSTITDVNISCNLGCTYSITGTLPTGLTHSNGVISGTPTSTGTVTVKVSGYVTEGPSQTATIEIPITISENTLSITSQPPVGVFKVGSSYSYTLAANQSVTWSLVGAPDWLAVNNGKIVGSVPTIYTVETTETFQVRATTTGGQSEIQNIVISIEPVLVFTSVPTASCVVTPVYEYDKDGNFSVANILKSAFTLGFDGLDAEPAAQAEGNIDYTAPDAVDAITGAKFTYNAATNITGTTFSKVSGASWLSITSAGVVSGTAPAVTEVTDHQIVIKATSPKGQTINQTVTITVYPVAKLTSSALSTQVHQNSVMSAITVTSNVDVTWSTQGTIPAGVTFSNGVLSGTPTERGSFPVTVLGTTTAGPSQTASVKVTIVVGEPVLQITSTAPTDYFKVGQQYSYTPSANVDGITWSITGTGITDWLAVSGGKVIGQVPAKYTDATTATYTLKAVSPEGQEVTQSVSIAIEPIIVWTSVPTAACVVQPVYDYSDDGSYTPTASRMSLFMSYDLDAATDSDGSGDTENTAITETGTRTFRFTWTGENAQRVVWDFGDDNTAEGFSVVHTYAENGTYTYRCTGINDLGESSVTGKITVDVDDGHNFTMIIFVVLIFVIIVIAALIIRNRKKAQTVIPGRRH